MPPRASSTTRVSRAPPCAPGVLDSLATEAPLEWRPVPANAAFLGFFRFKEWMS